VLLTHGHYDHLDLPTLRALGAATRLLVPEGQAGWLQRKGFREIEEIPWFGCTRLADGVEVHGVPARHFTARTPWDRNRAHWSGWVLRDAATTLWHAGDSGWCPAFAEIGGRFGPVDFAMLPIGAYAPRWLMEPMHMNPEEAVAAFLAARCRRAVAMHWGTFRLTDEPLGEPPLRLAAATRAAGLPDAAFRAVAVGEVIDISPLFAIGSGAAAGLNRG
jgi:L-ascorbate metabolism protein UlaG (beta-lactamase superfamily)